MTGGRPCRYMRENMPKECTASASSSSRKAVLRKPRGQTSHEAQASRKAPTYNTML